MQKFISWVEIPAVDFERAVTFYNSVFNLNLQMEDFGKEKMACFPNDEGAISFAPNFNPSENGVLVSLTAPDSVAATLERIEKHGGRTVVKKTKISAEDRDYFATFIDTEGNRIGIYGK